jgi:endonuclease IV
MSQLVRTEKNPVKIPLSLLCERGQGKELCAMTTLFCRLPQAARELLLSSGQVAMGNTPFAGEKSLLSNYIPSTKQCQRRGLCLMKEIFKKIHVNIPFVMLYESCLPRFIRMGINPEIGFDAAALDQYNFEESRRVAADLHAQNLSINLHGPFMDLSPGSPDPSIRALTRERFDRMIRLAALYKAERVIFHAGYDGRRYGYMQELWTETAGETWSRVAKGLEHVGSILILENVVPHKNLWAKLGSGRLPRPWYSASLKVSAVLYP